MWGMGGPPKPETAKVPRQKSRSADRVGDDVTALGLPMSKRLPPLVRAKWLSKLGLPSVSTY